MRILSFHVTDTLNSLRILNIAVPSHVLTASVYMQSLSCYVFNLAAITRHKILRVQYHVVGEADGVTGSSVE